MKKLYTAVGRMQFKGRNQDMRCPMVLLNNKEKRLQSELKRLTRSERTHRLCTRAGMLETFLKEPTTLTDDDVMELLTFIFHSEAVQKKLDLLIANRKELGQPNGS
jgi:hypothetical protein